MRFRSLNCTLVVVAAGPLRDTQTVIARASLLALVSILVIAGCGAQGTDSAATQAAGTQPEAYGKGRCPGRGASVLPLGPHANMTARRLVVHNVGKSPAIEIAVRRLRGEHGHYVTNLCPVVVARRTLYVATYDHRFDSGPNKSASLAQHRFYVGRFEGGYRIWFQEH